MICILSGIRIELDFDFVSLIDGLFRPKNLGLLFSTLFLVLHFAPHCTHLHLHNNNNTMWLITWLDTSIWLVIQLQTLPSIGWQVCRAKSASAKRKHMLGELGSASGRDINYKRKLCLIFKLLGHCFLIQSSPVVKMNIRPKPGDTDDDLIRQNAEFLKKTKRKSEESAESLEGKTTLIRNNKNSSQNLAYA